MGCLISFDKLGYDALQFTQIKVQKNMKHEDNILFWQMIKMLTVTTVIY